jgi:hypothetical protein
MGQHHTSLLNVIRRLPVEALPLRDSTRLRRPFVSHLGNATCTISPTLLVSQAHSKFVHRSKSQDAACNLLIPQP